MSKEELYGHNKYLAYIYKKDIAKDKLLLEVKSFK